MDQPRTCKCCSTPTTLTDRVHPSIGPASIQVLIDLEPCSTERDNLRRIAERRIGVSS